MEAISKQFMEEYDRGLKQNALVPLNGRVNQLDSTTVKTVKVGSTSYSPSNGVVTLPEDSGGISDVSYDTANKKITKTVGDTTLDVVAVAKLKTDMGLGNVTNDAQVKRTEMGTANGVATLGQDGKVPSSQLPNAAQYTQKVFLEENGGVLTQAMVNTANTIYVIQYDYDLNDGTIQIFSGCTLEFAGGRIKNGTINNQSGPITINGYGCLVKFQRGANVTFVTPYHVSTIHGLKESSQADGSPEKPFYYIQDALNICNNIVLERNSIFWIDQAVHSGSDNDYYMAKLYYDGTSIGVYGSGRPPVFTGLSLLYNQTVTEMDAVDGVHLYKHDFSNAILKSDNVRYTVEYTPINIADHPQLTNFGILSDTGNVQSKTRVLNTSPQEAAVSLFKNYGIRTAYFPTSNTNPATPTGNDYLTLVSVDWERMFFTILSAGVGGIDCNNCSISISDCIFEHMGQHAICSANGKTAVDNCLFRYIGGSIQEKWSTWWVRYGNAIESYGLRDNGSFTVKNCSFDTIFDTAITIQGVAYPATCNSYIYGNTISNARMAIEFFGAKQPSDTEKVGSRLHVQVFNNVIKGSVGNEHYLWYQYTRVGPEAKLADDWFGAFDTQSWELPNLKIYDNIIIDSILWFATLANQRKPTVFVHNQIFVKNKDLVIYIMDEPNNIYNRLYADISKPNEIIDFLESVQDGGRDVSHSNIIRISNKANTRGTFSQKPSADEISIGHKYFCTDRKVDMDSSSPTYMQIITPVSPDTGGMEINYKGQDTTVPEHPVDIWVDALGRVVN